MRKLASLVDDTNPHVLAVCEIESGDALSLATRFALQWAYRGHQALFWSGMFSAERVRDLYLPARPARPFERRGFVCADARFGTHSCTLAATQFSGERESRIPELRFARTQMRAARHDAVLFAHLEHRAIAFGDLGFCDVTPRNGGERIFVRGFEFAAVTAFTARV